MNTRQHRLLSWQAGLWVTLAFPTLCAADQSDLLAVVRAGHRSLRESIRTFSTSFTIHHTIPSTQVFLKGKYSRSFDLVRVQEVHPGGNLEDYLLHKSEIRQVGRSKLPTGGGYRYAAARRPASEFLGMGNIWTELLMEFRGSKGRPCDFDQLLESAKRPPKATRARTGGRDCIQVQVTIEDTGADVHFTTWHDIGLNYLIRRLMVVYGDDSANRAEVENQEFEEAQPGVFFPTKSRTDVYRNGKQVDGRLTTLSDVRINTTLPDSLFQLPTIPAGTVLRDWVKGTTYAIDGNWNPSGPSKPLIKKAFPTPADAEDAKYYAQSTDEPGSWTRWLILASLVVLGIAAGCWLYRRYRSPQLTHA